MNHLACQNNAFVGLILVQQDPPIECEIFDRDSTRKDDFRGRSLAIQEMSCSRFHLK